MLLFYRDFVAPSGGHLKVRDYFEHARHSQAFEPRIHFTARSAIDAGNPWLDARERIADAWRPDAADALFLAGTDWDALPERIRREPRRPVVNLVQGLRHADPGDARFAYLRYPAIRICVNPVIEQALRDLGVREPILSIPIGLNLPSHASATAPSTDVLIAGLKAPALGTELAARFARRGWSVRALTQAIPRADFLDAIASARVTVTLPFECEGFFLPALETMALGGNLVCPRVPALASFAVDGRNCLLSSFDAAEIEAATARVLSMTDPERAALRQAARATAARYTLQAERRAFLAVLDAIDDYWRVARAA